MQYFPCSISLSVLKTETSSWEILCYRSDTVYSNTVNSKFRSIQIFYKVSVNSFSIISCLNCTVHSNFHLIRNKSLATNDFELTVPDLYIDKEYSSVTETKLANNAN